MEHSNRRRNGFLNLVNRFLVSYPELLGFIAGWSSYPIGSAMLALLGFK